MEIITKTEAKAKGLKRYFTGKPCKNGHVAERHISGRCTCTLCIISRRKKPINRECKVCGSIYMQKRTDNLFCSKTCYGVFWRNQNIDHIKRYDKESGAKYRKSGKASEWDRNKYVKHREMILVKRKKYRDENADAIKERQREYSQRPEVKEKRKEYNKKPETIARAKEWRRKNPLHFFIRKSLERVFNNWKGGREKAEQLHGYTYEQLKHHIESQFKEGMSWDNRSEWHIDHIKPVSVFIKEGVTDPAIINALSNLQPLWAHENLSKSAKWSK